MLKKIKVTSENSKVICGDLYITTVFAQNLIKNQAISCDYSKKIKHPILGQLIKYNGEYSRTIINLNK